MIIDTLNKITYQEIEISESELQNLVIQNFDILFPKFRLIKKEFSIKGDVRLFGMSGRIDILAYNHQGSELVIIELKKNHTNNILIQALDYSDFIEENIELISSRIKELSISERKKLIKKRMPPKIILMAKSFLHPTIRRSKKLSNNITLYKYNYFSQGLLQIKMLNNREEHKIDIYKKNTSNEDFHTKDIVQLVKEIIGSGVIDEKEYLIEGKVLTINPTKLYESYKEYFIETEIVPLVKANFLDLVKSSNGYICYFKTKRFKNKNTSVIQIKLN